LVLKYYGVNRNNRTDPNRIGLVWFGLDDLLKTNRTKPNRMHFYLAVRMTFMLKTEPNRTAITPINSKIGLENLSF
jgi:hypothetical protein